MPSKGIAILGSTGSIGRQTLDLIGSLDGRFRVISLSGGKNWELLSRQIVQFRPRVAAIGDPRLTDRLRNACATAGTRLVSGSEGLQEVAVHPEAELLLSGIVGAAGLEPTYAALEAGKTVALANKEAAAPDNLRWAPPNMRGRRTRIPGPAIGAQQASGLSVGGSAGGEPWECPGTRTRPPRSEIPNAAPPTGQSPVPGSGSVPAPARIPRR